MKLHDMSKAGRWKEMAAEVPDDLLREFCPATTYDGLAKTVEERFGGISDSLTLDFPKETPDGQVRELLTDLQKIPTAFEGFKTSA